MKIAAYRKKLQELDRLKGELEKMEKSARMKKELRFISDINKVLKKHSKTVADLKAAFPDAGKVTKSAKPAATNKAKKKRVRKSPPTRKFKHPKTGAIIKAKRTNNKELKSWAADLGVTVESMEVK